MTPPGTGYPCHPGFRYKAHQRHEYLGGREGERVRGSEGERETELALVLGSSEWLLKLVF